MKKLLFIVLFALFLIGCNSESSNEDAADFEGLDVSTDSETATEDASDEVILDETTEEASDEVDSQQAEENTEPPIRLRDYGHLQELLVEDGEEAQQLYTSEAHVFLDLMVYNDDGLVRADEISVPFPDDWKLHYDNREGYEDSGVYFGLFELENDQDLEALVNDFGSTLDSFDYTTGVNPATTEPTYMLEFQHATEESWYGKVYFHTAKPDRKIALVLLSPENKWEIAN